ncbi:MAG: thermonuclease family protein [Methylophilaceae bacterium]
MRTFFLSLLLLSFNATAAVISYIYDGDTVKIMDSGIIYKLRLKDIDAPERSQIYGLKSRRALMQLCNKASVQVFITGVDQYDRHLGKLVCNGIDANVWMIEHGHAWFYNNYSNDDSLSRLQQTAVKNKWGLWAYSNPTPPWIWRQKHPRNPLK